VLVGGETVFSTEVTRRLELGRQRVDEAGPYAKMGQDDCDRVVIAELSESTISRRHVAVQPLGPDRVSISNLSTVNTIWIDSTKPLETGCDGEFPLPAFLTLGSADLAVLVYPSPEPCDGLQSLAAPTAIPGGQQPQEMATLEQVLRAEREQGESRLLLTWLRNTMEVFQSAATSSDFLSKAARAVIDIVGLDHAAVLGWDGRKWAIDARAHDTAEVLDSWSPSQSLLERVRAQKRTFWKSPFGDASLREQASLMELEAYVASPILNSHGDVMGAVYGERRSTGSAIVAPITELEAMLVELLSYSVAAGLARLEQERVAVEARVLFEQFFTPQLSQQLQADPTLLTGKDATVTVLFCDIRGFSRISERVGAAKTFDWINAVMGTLSDCVIEHQGVLVDYIGDELVAMWGAPDELPYHADCACRAGLAMLEKLPRLSEQWQEIVGEPTSYCIGINTGPARVGNTGSKRKFKYGPLGNTVNLASRVRGATKFVRSPIVVTGETADQLDDSFHKRRLCSVEVVNIAEPIMLYELSGRVDSRWKDLKERYEAALGAYERADFHKATKILGNLLTDYSDDGPTVILLSRAVDQLARPSDDFSSVWKLSGK
jgi:adenylate cyclase